MGDGEDADVVRGFEIDDVIGNRITPILRTCKLAGIRGTGEPERGKSRIWLMAASTASKNSRPRFTLRPSYQRPAARYSTSASSSKRTRGFTASAVQPRPAAERLPKAHQPIRRPSPDGLAARFQPPTRLQLQRGSPFRRHPDWRATRPRHQRVQRSAKPRLLEELLAPVSS